MSSSLLEARPAPPAGPEAAGGSAILWALTEGRLVVGPLVGPDVAPCLACCRARLASNGHASARLIAPESAPDLWREGRRRIDERGAPAGLAMEWTGDGWRGHCVLPLPYCPCRQASFQPRPRGLADAVSPLFGLISEVSSWALPGLHPACEATLSVTTPCRLVELGPLPGIIEGAAFGDADTAWTSAVGETLERYAAAFMPAGLRVCAAAELGAEHLDPSNESFGGAPVGAKQPVRWAPGRRVLDGSPCWVQASAVYFPYVCDDREPPRSRGGSEGLAAAPSSHRAIEHATHERIERDAFMRAWRYGGPRRPLANPYPDRPDLDFTQVGNRFGLPVVAAFLESDDAPFATAGLAARATLEQAVEASAREAIGAQALYRRLKTAGGDARQARYRHAVDPRLRHARAAWRGGGASWPEPCGALPWDALVRRLPDAVAVDVTTPDVAALGVRVERVVIPGCHGFEPLSGESRLGGDPTPPPY